MIRSFTTLAAFATQSALAASSNATLPCQPSTFTFPDVKGAQLVTLAAEPTWNYSGVSLLPGTDVGGRYTIDFCNVTVTYSHVGWNDTINVFVWLPLGDWNHRLLGVGGGGYSGTFGAMYHTAAIAKGYVAIGTDAGHVAGAEHSSDPSSWVLSGVGNSNYFLLEDFGSRSLGELSIIGKHITTEFYGRLLRASYFTGCSGGGRQGFALAQKYPDAFDGILASSPAINIEKLIPSAYFAAQEMNTISYYPGPCEVKAFTEAAIHACDELDGVEDDIISNPWNCSFSAYDMIGQAYFCNGTEYTFTAEGAKIVAAAWTGPRTEYVPSYPYNKDADLTSAIITTECNDNLQNCTRIASNVAAGELSPSTTDSDLLASWFQYFIAKDPDFDIKTMTLDQYYDFLRQSSNEWAYMLGAADPNLDAFHKAGGKLISWHGMADTVLPPGSTSAYYDEVSRLNNQTKDFYRHFEAPGVGHCYGGYGPMPNDALESLINWVENGTAPETLLASSATTGISRPLCAYPLRQVYIGGDVNMTSSFLCE